MTVPRAHLALSIAGVLILAALGVFLSIRLWRPSEKSSQLDSPPAVAPATTTAPKEEPRTPEVSALPPSTAAQQHQQQPFLRARPQPEPVSAATAQALSTRYREIMQQERTSKELLQKHIDEDPELSASRRAKLEPLRQPLLFITLSQALDDPMLRLALLQQWKEAGGVLAEYLDESAAKFGHAHRYTGAADPAEMAARLKAMEPHFQAEYQRLLETMELSEEVARLVESTTASEVLRQYLIGYMMRHGYSFDRDKQTFVPRQ